MFVVAFLKAWFCLSARIMALKETPRLQYSSVPVYVTFTLRLLGFYFQSAGISTVYTFEKIYQKGEKCVSLKEPESLFGSCEVSRLMFAIKQGLSLAAL